MYKCNKCNKNNIEQMIINRSISINSTIKDEQKSSQSPQYVVGIRGCL